MNQKENSCDSFLKWSLPKMDLRPEGYRKVRGQVCKRIRRRKKELGLESFGDYRAWLEKNPEEWKVLDEMTRITISRFFRDKNAWEELGERLLPETIRESEDDRPMLRCWSADCASGEEPYSLSILWKEKISPAFPGASLEILATDAGPDILKRARHACYTRGSLREMPEKWREKAFYRKDLFYCLSEPYREPVTFYLQDIRKEMPEGNFDLVFCKNLVAMYFSRELAPPIFNSISTRMKKGAYLVLGNHEEIDLEEVRDIRMFSKGMNLYRKY